MSEIAKCPVCGKMPDVYHAMTSPGQRLLVKIECCDHAVASPLSLIEKWNQYAAAMELAKAFTAADALGEFSYDLYTAQLRVLEVFGGER